MFCSFGNILLLKQNVEIFMLVYLRYFLKGAFVFFFLLAAFMLKSQADMQQDQKNEIAETKSAYLGVSTGVNYALFRDFATSAQTYSGFPMYVALSHLEESRKRASFTRASYAFGSYLLLSLLWSIIR